jgi:hypothetical protein
MEDWPQFSLARRGTEWKHFVLTRPPNEPLGDKNGSLGWPRNGAALLVWEKARGKCKEERSSVWVAGMRGDEGAEVAEGIREVRVEAG